MHVPSRCGGDGSGETDPVNRRESVRGKTRGRWRTNLSLGDRRFGAGHDMTTRRIAEEANESETGSSAQNGRESCVARRTQYGPLFEVALGTGLRPGELHGMRWPDLDLYRGTLSVRETLIDCE